MTFDEILEQVRELLQSKGRVAYRALKRRFELDDEYLGDLKAELIDAEQVARDENGTVMFIDLNQTTGHWYTQAASCEYSPGEEVTVASAWTAAVTSGV